MTGGPVARGRPEVAIDRDEMVDVLFRRHCAGLVRLAMVLLGDRTEAEEVVQDAFVSLHRHWSTLRDPNAAGAYLRAAVVRGSRSRQRRLIRSRAATARLSVAPADGNLEDLALDLDQSARLAAAVRALPTRQREVVVARYYLGMTEAQTATLLDIGVGSVKRHGHRAMTALQRGIEVTP
ncbi:MAG TPA: sigma-70 family RNA polymerase sigma factor [Lapillicoccus sp.]|nr:sigma-70 family RNA polymerase sigma factor [Lapillicoccus sp.]